MKQRYAVVVLFALIIASSLVSLTSYKTTEKLVTEDVNQALAKALDEQQSDVISADTIQVFNSHLQIEGLRGNAVLAVDTKKGFRPRPQVSTATILSLSDQRPSMILWSMVLLWSLFCLYQHRRLSALGLYGGLALQDGRFVNAKVAQETRCQRDALHPHPTTKAHHRRTFRPQNRVRQGKVIRTESQIDRRLSD